jgi:hypothetical protein
MGLRAKPFLTMFTISAVIFVAIVIVDLLTPVPPRERLRVLRQEVAELRAAADSCRYALEVEEAGLLTASARLDSLRHVIEYYEGLDPRGVPADSYEVYLDVFNTYNSGVPVQEAAGDTLRGHWQACLEITERHNALADSARGMAEAAGLLDESATREPTP